VCFGVRCLWRPVAFQSGNDSAPMLVPTCLMSMQQLSRVSSLFALLTLLGCPVYHTQLPCVGSLATTIRKLRALSSEFTGHPYTPLPTTIGICGVVSYHERRLRWQTSRNVTQRERASQKGDGIVGVAMGNSTPLFNLPCSSMITTASLLPN
jgi:hypothetical protein